MDSAFVYDKFVTGKTFVGRKTECNTLTNLLEAGEHVVMYEPPKSGKRSLIQQAFFNMRLKGKPFMVAELELYNVRTLDQFLLRFGAAVIRLVSTTQQEYSSIISEYLDGTHFVFDPARFASDSEEVVSLNWEPDSNDVEKMLSLPGRIAWNRQMPYYVVLDDFQNLMKIKDYESLFSIFENILRDNRGVENQATFVLTGSMVNAMKYIFEQKKYFYRLAEYLPLQQVDDREIIEHIVRGLMVGGKVVERELVLGACKLFRGRLWYLNHFTAICDSMTKGYINEGILMDALASMLSVHEPRFKAIVDDLTDHQISLLRAVLDGVVKFSSSDVIEKYSLNSSANVRRVKDALCKKEIITFNEKDEPVILDPLFEYWVSKHYFNIKNNL